MKSLFQASLTVVALACAVHAQAEPLAGEAWQYADQAYAAYGRKDYLTADVMAQRALALRPDVPKLWLLRIYAIQNQGRIADALTLAETAARNGHGSEELSAAIRNLRAALQGSMPTRASRVETSEPAWRLGDAAYKAYAAGRYAEAEDKARQSLRLNPKNKGVKALLVYALEKQEKIEQAARAADEALAGSAKDDTLQALRDRMYRRLAPTPAIEAWEAYRTQNYRQAAQLAGQAVGYAPDVQSYQHLQTSAMLELKDFDGAAASASSALNRDPDDAISLAQRGYARQRQGHFSEAKADLDRAVQQDWLSDFQLASIKRIAADTLRADDASGTKTATAAPVLFCTTGSGDVLCSLLPAGSSMAGAGPGYQEASDAYAAMAADDMSAAVTHARAAFEADPKNLSYRLLLVHTLLRIGQQEEARQLFASVGENAQDVPPAELLSAAYAGQRLADNERARDLFSRAIDAADANDLELDPQARLNVRQAISDLDRTWGFTAALGYGTVGVMNSSFAPSLSKRRTLQSSAELYWRPPVIGLRDGSTFELYTRMNEALYDGTGGSTGSSTWQGVLGARWKPWGRSNVVFAAERLFRIGDNSRNDWLLRAAWSEGDGAGLRAVEPNWEYWQLYAEGDYFVQNPQVLGTFEARYGRSYRIDSVSPNFVATPYLVLTGGYDNLLATHGTAGIGPAVNLRYWFREDRYHAPQSFVDFNLQYRWKIFGDDRSNGIFAGLYFSY